MDNFTALTELSTLLGNRLSRSKPDLDALRRYRWR